MGMPGKIRMKTNAEATVALPLNQGTTKGMGCFIPFLIFLWLLSFHQGKESNNTALGKVLKNGSSAEHPNVNKSFEIKNLYSVIFNELFRTGN
jgi:hypothetical protein